MCVCVCVCVAWPVLGFASDLSSWMVCVCVCVWSGSGAPRPALPGIKWCLRHGSADHATCSCDSKSATILLPPEDIRSQYDNICLRCSLAGNEMAQCMRRAPVQTAEITASITELKTEMSSLRKAIGEVQDAQRDLLSTTGHPTMAFLNTHNTTRDESDRRYSVTESC